MFSYDIHSRLITFVNPEISFIRMRSGPTLFGLARVYCSSLSVCLSVTYESGCHNGAFTAWIAFTQQVVSLVVADLDVKASLSNKS